ncbi:pyruvate dehydrogenase E2 component [Mesomycoplasma conjunctivae]|uniref:Dihydrolipoyl dehydrogenase n=1 Tax=Mesomycoplasma conjunctivae (strain ATCC 25834 / NCTC 10147 / HRC/581) TaxID=572263 RepID=C5J5M2_MESCH|nr:dihydrolipoyl dehydrogenase [Mesomycoplasma conjunctivae]CAT04745.1 Dihydrolipoamide dehydrogenase [Mesomycoplasma conjunctivae]VEU65761.1 pyruvate dehydrogenase E2 component [Mesomycoplasma conjunctivae]
MYKFKFADIGEGLHEGVVAEIYKKEGDQVNEGDSLFSVETDKITSDIPSPTTGKIVKVLMNQGDTIHVGQEIYYIDDGSGDIAEEPSAAAPAPKPAEPAEEGGGASVVGEVKVSNELLSFDFGSKKSTSTAKPTPAPVAAPSVADQTPKTTSLEKGKLYSGAIESEFDVIVVGSGPGGYLAAAEAGAKGLKTAIVEKEFWGGVCLNVGCIPTKAMLKTAEVHDYISHAHDYGFEGKSSLKISWEKMHERKRGVVEKLVGGVKGIVRGAKAVSLEGEAKFVGAREVEVNGKVYRGKNIILATGSQDRKIDLPGFEEGYKDGVVLTSKEAINLEKQPKSLVIVGGGVIGVEFAQIFASAGTKVTIIQNLPVILANLDEEISKEITKKLTDMGVEIIANATTLAYESNGKVRYEVAGKQEVISGDKVLVSVGRVPNSQGLAEVGIKLGQRGEVETNDYCQTNIEGVYAIGDVNAKSMLAHVAYRHAIVAVSHISGTPEKYSSKTVPACIYTHPEIASVGLTEKQAKEQGYDFVVGKMSFGHIGKAIAGGSTQGFAKLIVDKKHGEIIGAHIVGPVATDLISELIVAIDLETTIYEIASAIHPHPTFSEVIWEAARNAASKLAKFKK